MKLHSGDLTVFSCEECDMAFTSLRSYKFHRSNYHREKVRDMNECEICGVPFVSAAALTSHMEAEHDDVDEECPHCGQHFKSKKMYSDHILVHELDEC